MPGEIFFAHYTYKATPPCMWPYNKDALRNLPAEKFQGHLTSRWDAEMIGLSVFANVFFLLTRLVPAWHKVLWKISTSPLRSPGRMLTTSQWIIEEPGDGSRNTESCGITLDWNMHHAERAMMKSLQDEYSKRESKDIVLALKAQGCWCWKPTSMKRHYKTIQPSSSTLKFHDVSSGSTYSTNTGSSSCQFIL